METHTRRIPERRIARVGEKIYIYKFNFPFVRPASVSSQL